MSADVNFISTISPLRNHTSQSIPTREIVRDGTNVATIKKILVLDGGGIRGLSEIILLQEIMDRLSRERGCPEGTAIAPWEEFDMICGTSTGGLLAIMLGRLRMSLDSAEKAYKTLSERIFQPAHNEVDIPGKTYDFLKANGKFSSEPLEVVIQEMLVLNGLSPYELLYDVNEDGQACKV